MHTCHDLHGTKIISIGELIKKNHWMKYSTVMKEMRLSSKKDIKTFSNHILSERRQYDKATHYDSKHMAFQKREN